MASKVVKRSYRYRFYPTGDQAQQLAHTFGCVRYVYNRALAERSAAWALEQRRVTYVDTAKSLTAWKQVADTEWLGDVSNVPLQQALRNLQTAFVNFWQKRAQYPKFKRKSKGADSATYMNNAFSFRDGQIKLAKQDDPLNIVWSRPLPDGAEPSQVTVSRNSRGQYHISILIETTVPELAATTTSIGIDAGITALATLSTGEKIANPRHERRDREKLAKAQRNLARKQMGSNNRAKAKVKVAKVYGRIADRRRDHLHKLSTKIIRENQTVVIEDLSVRNMVRNHSLARSISDAAWSELRRQLEYKANWYGREVIAIDRWYPSSKLCSECGAIMEKLPLHIRSWDCRCGATHDRDINAAKNILAAGLAVAACGDGVRPPRS
ncbi:transposase [Mycolicibacterium fortuitum]|uniref:RNA-guided endonuclease InsQ/TnpB family protein n=1 Tax=Mycolicibacterium fortuitum TaxID=1766 RepID=UPI0022BA4AF7|nr:RNA-guided endonuclease TnpB family protein [Mycolicibacterium fortuitum]WAY18416.1 transposase [Mycolicibacterium fortuitum]